MKLADILKQKGTEVVTIGPERSLLAAAQTLVEHNIGAVVVTENGEPVGIFTERDLLQHTARSPEQLGVVPIGDVMSRDLVVAGPEEDLQFAMGVMTHRRIRHLPVVDDGALVGIVSIGDLLNSCLSLAEDENQHLKRYIQGTT